MKRQLLVGFGAVTLGVLVGCADDPTEILRDRPDRVVTSLSYIELDVGDSIQVTAQTRDVQGNALAILPQVASADAQVATVSVDEELSGNPVPETVFYIKASGFGQTEVSASRSEVETPAIVRVVTFPAAVEVTGPAPGTVFAVGAMVQLTATPVSTTGQPVSGPTVTWESEDETLATVDDTGLVSTLAAGRVVIKAEAPGGATGEFTIDIE